MVIKKPDAEFERLERAASPRYHRYREMARAALVRWVADVHGTVERLLENVNAVAKELKDEQSPFHELMDPIDVGDFAVELHGLSETVMGIIPPVRLDISDPTSLARDYRGGGMG